MVVLKRLGLEADRPFGLDHRPLVDCLAVPDGREAFHNVDDLEPHYA